MSFRSLQLSSKLIGAAEAWLGGLAGRSGIVAALMTDRGGYVIAQGGQFTFLPADEVGAIIAASYGALGAIASLTAAKGLTIKFHDSPIGSLMIAPVNQGVLLAVLFDDTAVTSEGTVRAQVSEVVNSLAALLSFESESTEESPDRPPLSSLLYIEDKLDELFREL